MEEMKMMKKRKRTFLLLNNRNQMVGRKREVECRLNVKKSLMISQQTKEKLRLKLKKFRKDLRKKKNNQKQNQKDRWNEKKVVKKKRATMIQKCNAKLRLRSCDSKSKSRKISERPKNSNEKLNNSKKGIQKRKKKRRKKTDLLQSKRKRLTSKNEMRKSKRSKDDFTRNSSRLLQKFKNSKIFSWGQFQKKLVQLNAQFPETNQALTSYTLNTYWNFQKEKDFCSAVKSEAEIRHRTTWSP